MFYNNKDPGKNIVSDNIAILETYIASGMILKLLQVDHKKTTQDFIIQRNKYQK